MLSDVGATVMGTTVITVACGRSSAQAGADSTSKEAAVQSHRRPGDILMPLRRCAPKVGSSVIGHLLGHLRLMMMILVFVTNDASSCSFVSSESSDYFRLFGGACSRGLESKC